MLDISNGISAESIGTWVISHGLGLELFPGHAGGPEGFKKVLYICGNPGNGPVYKHLTGMGHSLSIKHSFNFAKESFESPWGLIKTGGSPVTSHWEQVANGRSLL
jgi:hypothetical protein